MTDSDSEPTADHPLWLDWLATFIAAKGLPSDTLEKGRLPRHRAVRWVGHLSGGDYPFPTAREALRAVLREVGDYGRPTGSGRTSTCQARNRRC